MHSVIGIFWSRFAKSAHSASPQLGVHVSCVCVAHCSRSGSHWQVSEGQVSAWVMTVSYRNGTLRGEVGERDERA
jgi:hypothetical protein